MPSLVKMLRDLADAYEREEKGEADSELRQEIDELKQAIKQRPAAEARDALDELDDEERELIAQHRAGRITPPAVEEPEPAVEDPPARKTRPGRRQGNLYEYTIDEDGKRVPVDIPTIYNGPDEPDEVELDEPAADAA